ncbi:hypothetical protein BVRB_7g169650 [Beta vulgaris subsp. vulgaris]|nr:hypothetical protein BVRB_7g169650 [Beta vulgaris subsp. vulgaris]
MTDSSASTLSGDFKESTGSCMNVQVSHILNCTPV